MTSKRLAAMLAMTLMATACSDAGSRSSGTSSDATALASTSTTAAVTAPPTSPASHGPPDHLADNTRGWDTDWSQTTIDLTELRVGIPASDPRDRIRPIDGPTFESIEDADWLTDRDPGLLVEIDGSARFYPLSILTLHEIVNDELAGVPIAVTFCPLCNTGVAFDRRVGDNVIRFGVSGLLRNSDLVMWDDLTDSLWQQATGEGIVGDFVGVELDSIPSAVVSLADFAARHPRGEVLVRPLPGSYPYGLNPYEFYSSRERPLGFFDGEIDGRLPALERVVGLEDGISARAYPFSELEEERAVNDHFGGVPIVVLWGGDTADALDTSDIRSGRTVGTGVAFERTVSGRVLTFTADGDDAFRDTETGTTWSLLGEALEGPLQGSSLELAPHRNDFWFAWSAFHPQTDIYSG